MKEYSYMCERSNKIAVYLSWAFFVAAVLTLGTISVFPVPFLGLFQFACAIFFTMAILLLTRYVFKSFLIRTVSVGNGRFDLTVSECRGKERVTVCRVSLSNVERVIVKTKENANELKEATKGRKLFSYYPDICPKTECFLFVTECGEPLVLKLSPDETLLSILLSAQKTNEPQEE